MWCIYHFLTCSHCEHPNFHLHFSPFFHSFSCKICTFFSALCSGVHVSHFHYLSLFFHNLMADCTADPPWLPVRGHWVRLTSAHQGSGGQWGSSVQSELCIWCWPHLMGSVHSGCCTLCFLTQLFFKACVLCLCAIDPGRRRSVPGSHGRLAAHQHHVPWAGRDPPARTHLGRDQHRWQRGILASLPMPPPLLALRSDLLTCLID